MPKFVPCCLVAVAWTASLAAILGDQLGKGKEDANHGAYGDAAKITFNEAREGASAEPVRILLPVALAVELAKEKLGS